MADFVPFQILCPRGAARPGTHRARAASRRPPVAFPFLSFVVFPRSARAAALGTPALSCDHNDGGEGEGVCMREGTTALQDKDIVHTYHYIQYTCHIYNVYIYSM